ncbi:lipopolysaccharide export LptBFGC system permease protein LptF [Shimia isoporae]|uniref:Lipopolysaccharide export LptBFGC system permease protein LptF n=1 Tax=Shimia isoporae TaxID=647720 RepID=A0A4V2Q293_9RHOB|nr:LptF/LptG family permease [Shimia isoporae]TCL01531.1 lipopolysaccharide export LptBFGC system permease protein LptF [Shimia isoporae]
MMLQAYTGTAVRMIMRSYLQSVGFVMFALLVIALSIDLTKTLESLRAKAETSGTPLWQILLPYMSYRAADILTRLLGTACVIGGFVAALLRHLRREDDVLAAAGMSPRFHFTALLAVAAIAGAVQFSFQNWVRPAAVQAQIDAQLGRYGQWFGEASLSGKWIVGDNMAIRATVMRGKEGQLLDLKIFDGLAAPSLTRIIAADSAVPSPGQNQWLLKNVTVWSQETAFAPSQSKELIIQLPTNAAQIGWFDIHGFYLPNAIARRIAELEDTPAASDAATTLAFRKASLILPGVLIFLGASLAQAGISGRRLNPPRLFALAAIGYLTVVIVKSFWILGINGKIAPQLAATLPLAIAFGIACLIQLRQSGYLVRPKLPSQRHSP